MNNHKKKGGIYIDSIIEEIKKTGGNQEPILDRQNYNRYMVITKEKDHSKTAYCFSVPIRYAKSKEMIDFNFSYEKNQVCFQGSNAKIFIPNEACFKDEYGSCFLIAPGKIVKKTHRVLYLETDDGIGEIKPTTNGLLYKIPLQNKTFLQLELIINQKYAGIKSNGKYLSIMREKFVPYITISCVGVLNHKHSLIAPCEIKLLSEKNGKIIFSIEKTLSTSGFILFEINPHEKKLFQDTTVESNNPKSNNAFGGIAFLGKTDFYGEQWLYSRLEFSNLRQLYEKKLKKIELFLPDLNHSNNNLVVNKISDRFCSFGSNWDNKINVAERICDSQSISDYNCFDLTGFIDNHHSTYNFLIRNKETQKSKKLAITSTGDSYYYPQILKINYI